MSISSSALESYLNELLQASAFKDYACNGIQVSGTSEIKSIATSATASLAICQEAAAAGADALLVHHGIIWGRIDRITGMLRPRLATLLAADCNLLAYHLPLDTHAEWGNNSKALTMLGASNEGSFGDYQGQPIGRWGQLASAMSVDELVALCQQQFNHEVVHCPGKSGLIKKVGIVTGGGQSCLLDAAAHGLDALITGEVSEQSWHEAAESGCHCFACGHYATESHAIHDLGAHVAEHFDLKHLRLDQINPI
jgi:dinuclear metal center YbgI/SA1388 family protein